MARWSGAEAAVVPESSRLESRCSTERSDSVSGSLYNYFRALLRVVWGSFCKHEMGELALMWGMLRPFWSLV